MVVEDEPAESVMVAEAIESFIAEKGLEAPEMATIWLADATTLTPMPASTRPRRRRRSKSGWSTAWGSTS